MYRIVVNIVHVFRAFNFHTSYMLSDDILTSKYSRFTVIVLYVTHLGVHISDDPGRMCACHRTSINMFDHRYFLHLHVM